MNLFINELEFEKSAMVYLEPDSTTWVKSIITELVTKFPPLQQYPMTVTWQKKDDKRGYAVGSLKILNGAIPVIIEDYKLYPLDVIMFGNASIPLTPQVISEMLSNNSPFQGATNVAPKKSLELFGDSFQYSPINTGPGNTQAPGSETRDAVKVASFIDRLMVDEKTASEFLTKIANEDVYIYFKENGTDEVLRKIAAKRQISEETLEKMAYMNLDIDRVFIYEDELGNSWVKMASSELDDVIVKQLPPNSAIKQRFAEKTLNLEKTASEVEKFESLELIPGERGFFLFEEEKTAEFEVLDVKFLKNSLTEYEIFDNLMEKKAYFIDESKEFVKLPDSFEKIASDYKITKTKDFGPSDYGVFEWNNKIIGPVTISSIYGEQNLEKTAEMVIEGYSNYEMNRFYQKSVNFDILPHETEKNAWYLPKDVNFIPLKKNYDSEPLLTKIAENLSNKDILEVIVLENMQEKSYFVDPSFDSIEGNTIPANAHFIKQTLEKTASFEEVRPKHWVIRDCEGYYNLIGEEFNKYAQLGHQIVNLPKNDALWTLVHLGASEDEVEKVAEACKCSKEIEIENELKSPKSKESVSKEAKEKIKSLNKAEEKEVEETVKKANLAADRLIKVAAVLPDMSTVDAVLSLGLMKSFNIMEYIQMIPDYERIIGELCKLLIMVRMGIKQIPEAPIKNAVESLTEVLYGLKQLSVVMQNNQKR